MSHSRAILGALAALRRPRARRPSRSRVREAAGGGQDRHDLREGRDHRRPRRRRPRLRRPASPLLASATAPTAGPTPPRARPRPRRSTTVPRRRLHRRRPTGTARSRTSSSSASAPTRPPRPSSGASSRTSSPRPPWAAARSGSAPATRSCGSTTPSRSAQALKLAGPDLGSDRPELLGAGHQRRHRRSAGRRSRWAASVTGADGRATLSYAKAGIYRLKAARADSVRSPLLTVCVDPGRRTRLHQRRQELARASSCCPPAAAGGYASDRFTSRNMQLSWQGDDGDGQRRLRLRRRSARDGRGHAQAPPASGTRCSQAPPGSAPASAAGPGRQYEFRVTAIDRAGNRRSATGNDLLVPIDDRDRSALPLRERAGSGSSAPEPGVARWCARPVAAPRPSCASAGRGWRSSGAGCPRAASCG